MRISLGFESSICKKNFNVFLAPPTHSDTIPLDFPELDITLQTTYALKDPIYKTKWRMFTCIKIMLDQMQTSTIYSYQ